MAAVVREVAVTDVTDEQLDALRSCTDSMAPSKLRDALLVMIESVGVGVNVAVFDNDAACTPMEAAKRLGMSRTHLYKMLDKGLIPFHHVGRDRRIRIKDVIAFADKRDRDRRELAERFARMDVDNDTVIEELMRDM